MKSQSILFAFSFFLTAAFSQPVMLLPDAETILSPGQEGFLQLQESTESAGWQLAAPHREWIEWESNEGVSSGELPDSMRLHTWRFRAMKPGTFRLTFTQNGLKGPDTAFFAVRITPWQSPAATPDQLQQGSVMLRPSSPNVLKPGQTAFLSQQENPGTPFFWVIKADDPTLVSVDRQQAFPHPTDPLATGTHAWRVRALHPGKTVLHLDFVGPGKRGTQPALERVSYSIEITE